MIEDAQEPINVSCTGQNADPTLRVQHYWASHPLSLKAWPTDGTEQWGQPLSILCVQNKGGVSSGRISRVRI